MMYEDLIWSEDAGWIVSTPSPPTYSADQMAKRGDGAASARESVRAIWEAKLGKRLVWTLGEDQVWRLTDAPELATGRVVVTRKG